MKSEISRLEWKDINLDEKHLVLYTRKKKGGHLTPRRIPLNQKLFQILSKMYEERDKNKPWVFWHRYWSRKTGEWVEGTFTDRKRL
ncbi:MAG: site-specific integrase [Desulfamplus sp.]|nr:site-specific integrase [Desulfamplus sp.]